MLDASAAIELLLGTPAGRWVAARIAPADRALHAPHLLDVEVAQVLRRFVAGGAVGADRASEALDDLDRLPIQRWEHRLFLPRIWALRANLTAYDAAYVALAEGLGATLLTTDQRLARGVHRARVEVPT